MKTERHAVMIRRAKARAVEEGNKIVAAAKAEANSKLSSVRRCVNGCSAGQVLSRSTKVNASVHAC
jgi:hypothetical protein